MSRLMVIQFPEIQEYQDKEGFNENSYLINDGPLFDLYGSSAYFVDEKWIDNLEKESESKTFYFKRLTKGTIWHEEQISIDALNQEQANSTIKDLVSINSDILYEHIYDTEYIYETFEEMTIKQNSGEATVELYDENSNLILENV